MSAVKRLQVGSALVVVMLIAVMGFMNAHQGTGVAAPATRTTAALYKTATKTMHRTAANVLPHGGEVGVCSDCKPPHLGTVPAQESCTIKPLE